MIAFFLVWANWPTDRLPEGTQVERILVEKGERKLTLFSNGKVLKTYEISLGRSPTGSKEREGDQKTPEGEYRIIEHFDQSAFHRSLRISYPEKRDIDRARNQEVSPGSDIMIHGIRNGAGLIGQGHRWMDWTAGCIAVTNSEIEELWDIVPNGTIIEIRE